MNSRTDLGYVPVEVETRPERKLFSVGRKIVSAKGASALRRESCPFLPCARPKPADADYPFGHAKMEAVAALAQTGLLAALSVGVAVQAIERKRGAAVGRRESLRRRRRRVPHRCGSHALAGADPCRAPDLEPCARRPRAALFKRPHLVRAGALRPRRDA
jgi:hypothetical protein